MSSSKPISQIDYISNIVSPLNQDNQKLSQLNEQKLPKTDFQKDTDEYHQMKINNQKFSFLLNETSEQSKRVSIIGGGLVGVLLAICLAQIGYLIDIYQKFANPLQKGFKGGRSINLTISARGLKTLKTIGIWDQIYKKAIQLKGRCIHTQDNQLITTLYGNENQALYSISRATLIQELILYAQSQKDNIKFHFRKSVKHIYHAQSPTKIQFLNQQTQQIEIAYANFIIGADGAHSKVRETLLTTPQFSFTQEYFNCDYIQLPIPVGNNLEQNKLHVWPRGQFILLALPNLDGTFTCNLFMPSKNSKFLFENLNSSEKVSQFFLQNFPDAKKIMPDLQNDFLSKLSSNLLYVKCSHYHYKNTLLIGDSAHAIPPFFGQGMNCGFQDISEFCELLNQYNKNLPKVFQEFSQIRKPNADAILRMSLKNLQELRQKIRDKNFLKMKHIQSQIIKSKHYKYNSMYQLVAFHDEISYQEAEKKGQKQHEMLEEMVKDQDIIEKIQNNNIHDYLIKFQLQ